MILWSCLTGVTVEKQPIMSSLPITNFLKLCKEFIIPPPNCVSTIWPHVDFMKGTIKNSHYLLSNTGDSYVQRNFLHKLFVFYANAKFFLS